MVLCAGKTVRRTIFCPEPPRTKTLHEGCGCYSSPDTGERYDSDKKSQRTLVKFVDNKTLGKQTVAVVAISAVTCGLITLVDSAVIEFVNLLIK